MNAIAATMPNNTVSFAHRAINSVGRVAGAFARRLVTEVTLMEAPIVGQAEPMRCLLVGDAPALHELVQRAFGQNAVRVHQRHVPLALLKSHLEQRADDYHLAISCLPRHPNDPDLPTGAFATRTLVNQEIDVTGGWDVVRANMARGNRTRTNGIEAKYGLTVRLTRESADLESFYHEMYLPYITKRYGEFAVVDSLDSFYATLHDGFLLLVCRDQQPLAGGLMKIDGNRLSYSRTGLLGGDDQLLRCGSVTALYYYMLQHAIEHGYSTLDTLGSRPFLKDGVYNNKANWGAEATPYTYASHEFCFRPGRDGTPLPAFFAAVPLIVEEAGRLKALVGLADEETIPTDRRLDETLAQYNLRGLDEGIVLTRHGTFRRPLTRSCNPAIHTERN
jgi:hypothetical protein